MFETGKSWFLFFGALPEQEVNLNETKTSTWSPFVFIYFVGKLVRLNSLLETCWAKIQRFLLNLWDKFHLQNNNFSFRTSEYDQRLDLACIQSTERIQAVLCVSSWNTESISQSVSIIFYNFRRPFSRCTSMSSVSMMPVSGGWISTALMICIGIGFAHWIDPGHCRFQGGLPHIVFEFHSAQA